MARFKDFGAPNAAEGKEPISFKLHGEDFYCVSAIPGKVLLKFAAASADDDGAASAQAMESFFEKVMLPESYERFVSLAEDTERVVSVETLGEIVEWLVEELTNRPTQEGSPSSSGA